MSTAMRLIIPRLTDDGFPWRHRSHEREAGTGFRRAGTAWEWGNAIVRSVRDDRERSAAGSRSPEPRDRRPKRSHRSRAGNATCRRTRAHRRCAWRGENVAGESAGARGRGRLPAHSIHAGPDAGRRHRDKRFRPENAGIPAGARAHFHKFLAGRRNQSRTRENAIGAAGGHARAPGDD